MPDFPSGTVAFLFTDIEGSTRRWETQQQVMATSVHRHFALLDAAVAAHGGVRFKTIGDALQAAFPTVSAAVAAAIAGQGALRQEDWGALGPLRVRMAIHAGEATPSHGDYLAPALNRLARVLAAGYGEQVLLTEAARALLGGQLPSGHALRDLGPHRLRDLLVAEPIYQLTGPDLPLEFPPLKSLDRQQHNLPAQPTPLIGRETELAALRDLLSSPAVRLVTLTGPGGTGKTRLALQAAADVLDGFPDGVWWVPLAAIVEADLVPGAIAAALGVREVPGEPLPATLAAYLTERRALLLLDNLEHVITAAPMVQQLLDVAPQLTVLATSRQPLRLRAEREYPVGPLTVPGSGRAVTPETALQSPAVRLFVERAQAVKPGFALDAGNTADVAAICRRLDGLPLAIELAAARVRILSPAALLARLDQRLSILTGGARDLPARQQTLRAAIAWSHDLLAPGEQSLFARLAIFAGGCTFEAAEAVASAAGGIGIDLFDGLDSLVQQSLLRQEEPPSGDVRFSMLETIREYAQEQMHELPAVADIQRAHADFFLQMAESANWDDIPGQVDLLDRLDADYANLRQALVFYDGLGSLAAPQRIRMVIALKDFWRLRGHIVEGRRLLDRELAAAQEVSELDRAKAIAGAAVLAEADWDLVQARRFHEEALALYQEVGDAIGTANSLTGLGVIARVEGDLDRARTLHQTALDTWRAAGDARGTAGALLDLGVISDLRGDRDNADPLLRQSLELFSSIGDIAGEATALQSLGILALTAGEFDRASEHLTDSLRRWRKLGNRQMAALDLANLGESKHLGGALGDAEQLYAEALAIYDETGDPMGLGFIKNQLGRLSLDRGDPSSAIDLLLASLRLRWESGDRGGAADTLDALGEAYYRRGDRAQAEKVMQASDILRLDTGIARLPVYQDRYETVKASIGDLPGEPDVAVNDIVGQLLQHQVADLPTPVRP